MLSASTFQFLPDRGSRIANLLDDPAKLFLTDPKRMRPMLRLPRLAQVDFAAIGRVTLGQAIHLRFSQEGLTLGLEEG
jgi:hypothetical protein